VLEIRGLTGNSTGFILLTLALSIVTYRLIEAPFQQTASKAIRHDAHE
jgi:peptidoglycan/LPS O-acetylase OafA/YrhL